MSLRIKKSPNQRYIEEAQREPNKKIFIVSEGDKTEVRYFEGVKDHSKELEQDLYSLENTVGSNIGKIIEEMQKN